MNDQTMPKNRTMTQAVLRVSTLTALLTLPVHADTLTVCTDGGCDFTSVESAIEVASDGDVIQIAGEIHFVDEPIDTLGKAVVLRGAIDEATGEALTIFDGQTAGRVVQCVNEEGPGTVFENLVFKSGVQKQGGGMYCDGSSPTITNCTFTNNFAISGGGMYLTRGSAPSITNCRFTNNAANYRGGGIYNIDGCAPFITDSTFTGNNAVNRGGGLSNFNDSTARLTRCTFTNNAAGGGGGGIDNNNSRPTIIECTFTFNSTSGRGGGVLNSSGSFIFTPTFTDCRFTENHATEGGGGMHSSNTNPIITGTRACENTPDQLTGLYSDFGGNCFSEVCRVCDTCPGDLGGDGDVGGADLTILLNQWGCTGEDCTADLDGNGTVDGADLTTILSNWGACPN
jgi:parallel beta-helix repeat protein